MGFCERSQSTVLQGAANSTNNNKQTNKQPTWPCPRSSRTSTPTARLSSTSRSTWSSTPHMSTFPCLPTLPVMTLPFGFSKRFKEASDEEREHAMKLVDYQTMRGGRVVFREIAKPSMDEWGTALEAVEATLELEKTVNESLLVMHKTADDHGDAQMTDFLEGEFLKEQVEAVEEIADLVTKMKRAGDGIGLHIIDKELQG